MMTASVWEKRNGKDYCRLHDKEFLLPGEQCPHCLPEQYERQTGADLPASTELAEDHTWYRGQAEWCANEAKQIVEMCAGDSEDYRDCAGVVRALTDMAFKCRREATKIAQADREWKRTSWLVEQNKERH